MRNVVSIVLVPIDDFTDEVIIDKAVDIKIEGNSMKRPIKKQDGFFVFTNINEKNIAITIKSYYYNSAKLEVDIEKLNKLNPVVKVRLKPNSKYKFPKGITCINGKTEPNTSIKIIYRCKNNLFMLFEDNVREDSKLKIYNPLNIDLEGKSFLIGEKSKKEKEEFNIIEFNVESSMYLLDQQLKKSYKKEVCEILKIDHIDVFEDGKFFFPLKNFTYEQSEIVIEKEDGKKKEIKLILGIVNDVEFC